MEKEVAIRCRPQDAQLVESVMEDAAREFSELIKKETNFDFPCKVRVDTYHQLKENQSK